MVQHLAAETRVGEDPEEALDHDYDDTGQQPQVDAPSAGDDGAVGDTDEAGVADQFDPPAEKGEDD